MFNSDLKKEAIKECENANSKYVQEYDRTIEHTERLYRRKTRAVSLLKKVDTYIHSLSNRPKELDKLASTIRIRRQNFEKEVDTIKLEGKSVDVKAGGTIGAGVATGAGVAAFGPSAAMAVATTFGSASTGTAIASLSGAAATKAALAWLGGGALAAGGGGIAAGQAFLALAGPVGWAIGGIALVGAGLMASSKNKKIAEKAERQTRKIKTETIKVKKIDTKVGAEIKAIDPLNSGVDATLSTLLNLPYRDYHMFTEDDKDELMKLMNSAEALSKRIGVKIE